MPTIDIYTTPFCPFCIHAKRLLDKKGVTYNEINVSGNRELRAEMMERAGGQRKVPQIFIDGKHLGDCDELFELEFDEELDPLLGIGGER